MAVENKTDYYVPMNVLFKDKETGWTFTQLHSSYEQIAEQKIIMWCVENMQGRWTMLGGSKFGFEDSGDALSFKLKFS